MSGLDAPTATRRAARLVASYRQVLPSAGRHPATWLFVAICLLCVGYLAFAGYASLLPLAPALDAG